MVRAAAKNHASVAVVVDPAATRRCSRRSRPAASPSTSASGSPPRPSRTPRPTTSPSPPGWAACVAPDATTAAVPGLGRRDLGAGRRAALRREPAPARRRSTRPGTRGPGSPQAEQLHGKEMSYNNYVDADAAWRAAHDLADAGGRDHQARQPVRHRGRRRRRRGAPPRRTRCDPVSAFGGVIAANRAGHRGDGRAGRRRLHRGGRGAGVRRRGAGDPAPARRTSGCCAAPTCDRAAGSRCAPDLRWAAGAGATASTPRATTRRPGRWSPASRPDDATLADLAFAWRACRAVKSNAILLAPRRRDRRRRDGSGQPGRLRAARGRAGRRRAGPGRGGRVRRVLPVRRRARGADRRPGCGRSCSPAARCATTRSSPPPRRPGVTMYLTGTRHFFH